MGEILTDSNFGQSLISTVQKYGINNILEIGSNDGTGSTQCFITAMKHFPKKQLTCLEPRLEPFQKLQQNATQYPWVRCYNQPSIGFENFLLKDFETEVWNSPFNGLKTWLKHDMVEYSFNEDIQLLKTLNNGYLPNKNNYCGVLIDGSEFMGYSEYVLIKDKTNFIFLDDCVKAFKTARVLQELSNDPAWGIIVYKPEDRNGFAIARRKELNLDFYL